MTRTDTEKIRIFKDFSVRIREIRGIRVQNHGNSQRAEMFFVAMAAQPNHAQPCSLSQFPFAARKNEKKVELVQPAKSQYNMCKYPLCLCRNSIATTGFHIYRRHYVFSKINGSFRLFFTAAGVTPDASPARPRPKHPLRCADGCGQRRLLFLGERLHPANRPDRRHERR
jgi:hypothetical protein